MKIISTIDSNTIYTSLSEILNIKEIYIQHYIMKKMFNINKLSSINDIDVYDFLNSLSKVSGIDYNKFENISFDQITIAHLTTRIGDSDIENQPIYNLFDSLANPTELSNYLKSKELEFYKSKGILHTKYKGKLINWEDYFNIRGSGNARRINIRFKGSKVVGLDKCINGFLFNGSIYENGNVKHIFYCPEIIEDIANVLKIPEITKYWYNNASKYIIIFKVNIKDIIFDGHPNLNTKQKIFRIYRYIIFYLSKSMLNNWSEHHNPIIRLKNDFNVPNNNIVEINKIEGY